VEFADGRSRRVSATFVGSYLAVHRGVTSRGDRLGYYVVTHRASGRQLAWRDGRAEALAVAEALDRECGPALPYLRRLFEIKEGRDG